MPTIVTKTIGSGKDYATFSLATADINNIATAAFGSTDLVANDGAIVFEADAGYYNETVYISNSIIADATRTVTLKPAAGSEHNGKIDEGVVLIDTGAGQAFLMNTAFHTIDGLSIQNSVEARQATIVRNCNISAIRRSNGFSDSQSTSNGSIIENCWLEAGTRCINTANTNTALTVRNCTFHNTNQGVRINTNCLVALYNNFAHVSLTSQSTGNTIALQGSGNVTEQTFFGNLTLPAGDGLFAGNQTWTLTTDTNASSTGNQAIFDPYSSKLYDVTGNDAWKILTNLSNVPSTDITGASRKATGYNPGAFEEDAAGSTPPGRVFNPTPSNGATDVSTSTTLSWSEPTGVYSLRQVYLGTSPGSLTLVSTSTSPVTLATELDNGTTYYWRVDLTNSAGTTQGITFVFTTEAAPPTGEAGDGAGETVTTATAAELDVSSYDSRSRQYPTREGDIRKKIFKMTQAKQNISFVYKESLRSMIASFNDLGYISAEDKFKEVKCLHANAERAIAKLKQEDNIILPMVTITQTNTANDDARRRQESVLVNEKYWDADKNRAFRVLSLAPRPININYQLNVWCKYMADMDQILEQIRLKFNPEMNVPTEFSTIAKAFLDTEEDVGSITAGDKEDRIIKKTFNIVFRTYVPNPKFLVTSTGKIEEFINEITLP